MERFTRERMRGALGWWSAPPSGLLRRVASRSDLLADLWGEFWTVVLLVVVIAGILAHAPLVVALGAMASLVALGARAWAKLSLEEVEYTRETSADRVFAGDQFELVLTVVNRKPLPLPWLRILDAVPNELSVAGAELVAGERADARTLARMLSVGWYERLRFRYRITAEKRGYLVFGPARMESGDLFGLFRAGRVTRTPDTVIVYPRPVPMPDFDIPTPRPIGDAKSRDTLWEDVTRPAGLREYASGDPIRRVDWKATARRGELLVRNYDRRVAQSVVIAVDIDTSARPWEGYSPQMLERVVTAAASVAVRLTEMGHRVGLISNAVPLSETARMVLAPGSDPGRLTTILESLAMVRPISVNRIERVLDAERAAIPYGASLVVVSSMFGAALRAECDRLARSGHPALLLYVGDEEAPVASRNLAVMSGGDRFDPPATPPRKGRAVA